MPRENLPNVSASKNLKDIGKKNMLGRQNSRPTAVPLPTRASDATRSMGPVLAQAQDKDKGEPKHEKTCSKRDEAYELSAHAAVKEDVRHRRGGPGSLPEPSYANEEHRLLAQFFVLLDQMDRAHAARNQRKEAA